jgi:DNA-binding CsgD family transcriptional regulator
MVRAAAHSRTERRRTAREEPQMRALTDSPAVGRETEFADAVSFVAAAAAGPAALLVDGDAGIGKTTVWRTAAEAARDRGHRVLSATAVDLEADLPFVVLRDLLEPVPAEVAAELPAAQRHALDMALLRSTDGTGLVDQHAVSVAVLGVVRALATERPLVIAVDDVGWIDCSSERVLRYVIRRLTAEPVGVLVALRSGPGARVPLGMDGPPIGDRLQRAELGPLDGDQLYVLLTERAGLELPRRVCRAIHRAAGGNPFYALEIGRAVRKAPHWTLSQDALPLPGDVQRVTAARVRALTPHARRALAVVATSTSPTAALVNATVGELAVDGLEEAAEEGLLEITDSGITFTHPLLRAAVTTALTVRERRELHRELAAVVPDADERILHMAAAAAEPDEAVATALDDAACRAFARGAPDVAAALAARAVTLTPPDSSKPALRRVRTAEYRYRAEDTDAAAGLAEVIAQLPPGELRAEARLWLAGLQQAENHITEAVEQIRAAVEEARTDQLRAAAQRNLAFALVVNGDPAAGNRAAIAAARTAEAAGDGTSIDESRIALAWTQFWIGNGLRTDLMQAARTRSTWTRFAPQGASANAFAGLMLSWADHIDEARATLRAEVDRLTVLGHDRPRALVLFTLAELECRAGNSELAMRHVDEGYRTAVLVGAEFYRSLLLYARGLVEAHRGRLDAARADAEEAVAVGTAGGAAVAVRFGSELLGFVELSLGDHAAVHRRLGPLAARMPSDGRFDPGLVRFVPDEVEALVALGDHDAAAALLGPFEARAAALDRPWAVGAAGRCRALLLAAAGDSAGALPVLDTALAAHDRIGMPFEQGRTLLVAGSVRRRARRRQDARTALTSALEVFNRLGARTWAARAQSELDRTGARRSSPSELTESERRVAELVAAGRTNREIAAAQFLTVGTVEAALWKIYRKLDVRSRTELAARMTDRAPSA